MLDGPLHNPCPVCGQLQGSRCHDTEGHIMDGYHVERSVPTGSATAAPAREMVVPRDGPIEP